MAPKQRIRVTHKRAYAMARTCKTRSELALKHSGCWRYLSRNKMLDDACSHMDTYTQWTTEKVHILALTCKTRNEFKKKHHSAYLHMCDKKLQSLCYAHMGPPESKGRKLSQKTIDRLEKEKNCVHKWQKINLSWGVYNKCLKCRISVKVEKTQVEKISDLIKSKIAR